MKQSRFSFLYKDAYQYVGYGLVLSFLLWLFGFAFLSLLALASTFLYGYVYRQPDIFFSYAKPKSVLAPVEGVVVSIKTLEDGMFGYEVEIEGSFQTEAILRVPIQDATLKESSLTRGTRLPRESKLFAQLNEYATVLFQDKEGNSVFLKHRLQKSIAPLSLSVKEGKSYEQSEVYGVAFNAITTLYLPHNFHFDIQEGAELYCAQTILGYFD